MKHVVRVVIAVLVVALLGYLVYFFAFKPDPDNSTFNSLVALEKYKDEKEIETKSLAIKNLSELNDDQLSLSQRIVHNTDSQYTYYGYIDEVYDYYFGYTEFVKNVKLSSQQAINTKINNYRSQLALLSTRLQDVIDYKTKDGTGAGYQNELTRYFELALEQYVATNKAYCSLTEEMKKFVEQYVFGGNLIEDTKSAQLDVIEQSVSHALSQFQLNNEANFSAYKTSIYKYHSKYNESSSDGSFLDSYVVLNISSTKDGKGDTYLTILLELTTAQQKDFYKDNGTDDSNNTAEELFPDDTLISAARALLKYYGIIV